MGSFFRAIGHGFSKLLRGGTCLLTEKKFFPIDFDWGKRGVVPHAKDQSSTGEPGYTCWVFSPVSSIESAILINKKLKVSLSQQAIVDYFIWFKYIGGPMHTVYRYAMNYGLSLARDYPNEDENARYKIKGRRVRCVTGFTILCPESRSTFDKWIFQTFFPETIFFTGDQFLMSAVMHQPVVVVLCMDNYEMARYKKGVYRIMKPTSSADQSNHVMLLIGFRDDYWILLNSWGPDWGEHGLVRISREALSSMCMAATVPRIAIENPFKAILTTFQFGKFYCLPSLADRRLDKLPYSIRILLESAIRNCDNFQVTKEDVENIFEWKKTSRKQVGIPFKPARVLLQDFTGVPTVVDLACMRETMKNMHFSDLKINLLVPVDLVIDHSVQVDVASSDTAAQAIMELEFQRNKERFTFLKWGSTAFCNMRVIPPGSGTVHQVNLEYLGRVVFNNEGLLYPDSVVGTDSHTTMIGGLGVVGWGVGGIEAEAAMLGQPISMILPGVVGVNISGKLLNGVTSTDLVLTVTEFLRKHCVAGKFVEFHGEGVGHLSIADRASIANMSPEYGAIMGFFPVDHVTLQFLKLTGRSDESVAMIESYLRANRLFVDYDEPQQDIAYSSYLEFNLSDVEPCISGPKRPHDRVPFKEMKSDWRACLDNKVGFKGFAIPKEAHQKVVKFDFRGQPSELKHGSVVIAAITGCMNTSNPSVLLGAGLVAKKAHELGLQVKPWVKTSLAPGSGFVSKYLLQSGLQRYLNEIGFLTVGCTSCIANSEDLDESVASAISDNDIVAVSLLSRNCNFEGHMHALIRANYLASAPLVVAYALAGTVDIDFEKEPIGTGRDGKNLYLRDIWPSSEEIAEAVQSSVLPNMFRSTEEAISKGNPMWNRLQVPAGTLYTWDPNSTYIRLPPYLKNSMRPPRPHSVKDAFCLMNFGDGITTDHISPSGSIQKDSPAAKFLVECGVQIKDIYSYGSRRGNYEVMARGTFANIHLVNKLLNGEIGPKTVYIPTGEKLYVYDAAMKYKSSGQDTIVLAGADYGSGGSSDWAAKGPMLLGVKAVIAKSFDRIHRSNLVGMGIIPLCFKSGEDADTLGLSGHECYTIDLPSEIWPGQDVTVTTDNGKSFTCKLRFDTEVELSYFCHGGILPYIIGSLLDIKDWSED